MRRSSNPKLNSDSSYSRLPLYAKECYGWDVLEARSIAETESSAIAYYFYAMEKGRELNLERLVELGLYIRFVDNHLWSKQAA